jgi:hypothetical protein
MIKNVIIKTEAGTSIKIATLLGFSPERPALRAVFTAV